MNRGDAGRREERGDDGAVGVVEGEEESEEFVTRGECRQ